MKATKIMAVVAVAAMVVLASNAYAGEGWGSNKGENGMKKNFDKMAQELNLTAEQRAALDKERETTIPKIKALRDKIRASREQLKTELDKARPDKAKLALLVEEMKNLTGEQIQMKIDKILAMKTILTPEQSAKMKSIRETKKKEFEGKRKGRGDKGGPHGDF